MKISRQPQDFVAPLAIGVALSVAINPAVGVAVGVALWIAFSDRTPQPKD